jgi:maltose alpha-D-glucosyltransferase/alpha-amylase
MAEVLNGDNAAELWPTTHRGEQSNSTVFFADRLVLKLFRKSDAGLNPDWELSRFLTERAGFEHTPRALGAIELRDRRGEVRTLGVAHELVPNEGDAWSYFVHQLGQYFERLPSIGRRRLRREPVADPLSLQSATVPALAEELFGPMLQNAELLGLRTAQLHLALASDADDPALRPEAFDPHYQRSLYQSIRNQVRQGLTLLRRQQATLGEQDQVWAAQILERESELFHVLAEVKALRISGLRMRIHGDYHLGQVLFTGKDFSIIDYEGEPAKAISARRIKRSPLRDVAGMLRSLDYAAFAAQREYIARYNVRRTGVELAELGADFWVGWVGERFLQTYLHEVGDLLVEADESTAVLLRSFILEKAGYELAYELNNRPAWVGIALQSLLGMLPRSSS